mgnify:CR=1 FL=1
MRLRDVIPSSILLLVSAALVPSVYAQQCSSGCYTQQSADMRQCAAAYGQQDKQNCRHAASERAAACIRSCNQGDKQQDRQPTQKRSDPRTF